MPYVTKDQRLELDVAERAPRDAGDLNYYITQIVDEYLCTKGLRYVNLNEVVGVLECVKAELYRRIAAPYEDQKQGENGDVYSAELITPPR